MLYKERVFRSGGIRPLEYDIPRDTFTRILPPYRNFPKGFRAPTDLAVSSEDFTVSKGFTTKHIQHRYTPNSKEFRTPRDHSFSGNVLMPAAVLELKTPVPSFALEPFGNLETRALNDMAYGDIDIGVTAVDFKDTLLTVAKRVTQLGTLIDDVQSMNRRQLMITYGMGRNTLNGATPHDLMLELSFAWIPLLSDIKAAYDFLRAPTVKKGWIVYGSARSTDSFSRVDKSRPYHWDSIGLWNVTTSCNAYRSVHLYARVENPKLYLAASLGMLNPATPAWEYLKFSYLIDYIAPISEFLNAFDATLGLSFLGGCRAEKLDRVSVAFVESESLSDTQGVYERTSDATGSYSSSTYVRTKLNKFPNPSVTPVTDRMTLHQTLILTSVLGQLQKKIRGGRW